MVNTFIFSNSKDKKVYTIKRQSMRTNKPDITCYKPIFGFFNEYTVYIF